MNDGYLPYGGHDPSTSPGTPAAPPPSAPPQLPGSPWSRPAADGAPPYPGVLGSYPPAVGPGLPPGFPTNHPIPPPFPAPTGPQPTAPPGPQATGPLFHAPPPLLPPHTRPAAPARRVSDAPAGLSDFEALTSGSRPTPAVWTPTGFLPAGRTAPAVLGSWTALDVFVGLGVVLLASTVLGWPFSVFRGIPAEITLVVAGFLPIWIGLAGTGWWSSRSRGTGNLGRDLGFRFRPVDLAIGLGLGVGYRVVSILISAVTTLVQGRNGPGNLDTITHGVNGFWLVLDLVLAVSIIAPVVEELFFRGLLIRSVLSTLQRRRPDADPLVVGRRRTVTVLVSALLFLSLHLQELNDAYSVLPLGLTLFMVGAVNALITLRTGRIGAAVVAHVVFNGIGVAVSLAVS
jgi:uncharacterized protein